VCCFNREYSVWQNYQAWVALTNFAGSTSMRAVSQRLRSSPGCFWTSFGPRKAHLHVHREHAIPMSLLKSRMANSPFLAYSRTHSEHYARLLCATCCCLRLLLPTILSVQHIVAGVATFFVCALTCTHMHQMEVQSEACAHELAQIVVCGARASTVLVQHLRKSRHALAAWLS
jgi:hypothetical protein